MASETKKIVAQVIKLFMSRYYNNSSVVLDYDTILNSLEGYDDGMLFNHTFYLPIEEFVGNELMPNVWYPMCAKNCNIDKDSFKQFMDNEEVINVLDKYDMSWIDCFYSILNGDKDICQSVHDYFFPPQQDDVEPSSEDYRILRVQENAIEIALNCFVELQNKTEFPRDIIISKIQEWAEEAEQEWEKDKHDGEYIDFIDGFTEKKKEAYLNEIKKRSIDTSTTDKVAEIAQKYAKEYTLDGTTRCTYEEVAEAIETAINEFSKNN